MNQEQKAPVIRRRILKAVQQSLAESWADPFWAQLEDAELDARAPLIDIQDRDDHLLLVAEMPGIPKENVNINVTASQVEITGENALACEIDHDDLAYLCNERSMTSFHRTIPLPKAVLPDGAEASMENGILVIKLPKEMPRDGPAISLKVS